MNPKEIREDFPVFQERPDLAYLDNAATSQKPQKVIKALENFYGEKNANVGRGLYDLAGDATRAYREARNKVADFIGASTEEIVFVRNTTEAENLLASSVAFEGDIVLSEMAHHSEQLPWRRKAEEEQKQVKYLETNKGLISVEDAEEKIDEEIGLVAISHISNVFGAVNPVEEIIEIAHRNNALVVLDAAQSAPHKPVDVKDLDADFLAFSGHKMLGPSGIGVLYGKQQLLNEMHPYQVGGGMISSVTEEEVSYEKPPGKFEAGTENVADAVGLAAAIDYLEGFGMEEIEQHDRKLVGEAVQGLEEIDGVNVLSPENAVLVSFTVDGVHPHDVAEVLNSEGIAVRAGHHCAQPQMEKLDINGTARVSPYLYNSREEIQRMVEAVEKTVELFRE